MSSIFPGFSVNFKAVETFEAQYPVVSMIGETQLKVVATNRIKDAQARYPAAEKHLKAWYLIMSRGDFHSEHELRSTFGDMRGFNHQFKFPIPETTLLVHTLINFESQVAFVDEIKPGNH